VFPYDRLLIATGARPILPDIQDLSLPGVHRLHTMNDGLHLRRSLDDHRAQSAVIVGSGYIGLEMADALTHRGISVTVMGRSTVVLPTVDAVFGRVVESELRTHGVRVESAAEVQAIVQDRARLRVESALTKVSADIVLVGAGVIPNAEIGAAAGVPGGIKGALRVNRRMETNLPHVYAAGDCVETWHRVLRAYTYLPLGTTAHKQGRIAGENALGASREFEGSMGTQVVKVFNLAIARTGLRDTEAQEAGFSPFTVETEQLDHKAYYPGARRLSIRITGDRKTGQLLGAQILGPWQAEVAKRIDVFAAALYHGMTVEGLNDFDLSYTPPLGSPWDAVQMAAQTWCQAERVTYQKSVGN
jgi:NADPH-dependent 2,4-dienoyl-CoA reductase/sulfur reductase-like enzyme